MALPWEPLANYTASINADGLLTVDGLDTEAYDYVLGIEQTAGAVTILESTSSRAGGLGGAAQLTADELAAVQGSGNPDATNHLLSLSDGTALFGSKTQQDKNTADIGDTTALVTVAKTDLVEAINEVSAQKTNAALVISGNTATPYNTAAQAGGASMAGDYVLLRGYQSSIDFYHSGTIDAKGAYFPAGHGIVLGSYPPSNIISTIKLLGGAGSNRVAAVRQNATANVLIEDYTIDGPGWFEAFALGSGSASYLNLTLRRCKVARTAGGGAGPDQVGCVSIQSRSDSDQRVNIYVEDCDFGSTIHSVFTGIIHPDCRIYLRGTTKLASAAGYPLATFRDVLGPIADPSVYFVDERPANALNGATLFQGSSGSFNAGTSTVSAPANTFVFLPMQTVSLDLKAAWDSAANTYTIPITGSYLIITKVLPAQGTQAGFTGTDFYCGPSTGVAADTEEGSWEQVSSTSRRGIKIPSAKHYVSGEKVGLAHYQEGGGYPVLCSLSIVLLKAD